jgi:hypothetical protein
MHIAMLIFRNIRTGGGGRYAAYVEKDAIDRFVIDEPSEAFAAQLGIGDADHLTAQEQLGHLFDGRRADGQPIDGRRYRSGPADRETGKQSRPLGSIAFCLSPHKSISILGQVIGNDHERKAVWQGHRQAVIDAMHKLSGIVGITRDGQPGETLTFAHTHAAARPLARGDNGDAHLQPPNLGQQPAHGRRPRGRIEHQTATAPGA